MPGLNSFERTIDTQNARSRVAHWCSKLLNGEKKIELRRYPINPSYLGQQVYLLQTPDGSEGSSTLPAAGMPAGYAGACIAGIVVFDGQTKYISYEQWCEDVCKHCVPPGTPYSWKNGETQVMYGWHIASVQPVVPPAAVPAMRRVHSSWFETDTASSQAPQEPHPATSTS